ncbi:acyl-CoA synthetase [Aurantivibrio plasticivorans]
MRLNLTVIETMASNPKPNRLEDWAQRTQNTTAIIQDDRSLTYAQWNQQADQVAHSLAKRGIGSEDIMVLRLQNSIEWCVLNAALSKLGAGVLGLNWRLTAKEIRFILENSGATAFACDDQSPEALLPAFDGLNMKALVAVAPTPTLSGDFTHYAALLETPPEPPFYSDADARLIIYTSGTTGFPKGVVNNRSNPSATKDPLLAQQQREYLASVRGEGNNDPEQVLVTMPMHHAAGPGIVRTAVNRGSTMVLMPRFDAEKVLQLIEQYQISTWNGVPTMFKRIAALPKDILDKYDVSSIKTLSVGAAPVPKALKQWIFDYFGPCLRENYGSTEVSMVSSLSPDMHTEKPGSCGKPFKHVKVSIRDAAGKELPQGETGEIWVYTPVAISNYLGADTMDEDTRDKNGFFRMGDVGYLDSDGYLYITDRIKDMIISGGVNIYPAEIEAALIQHPAIQDIAVIGVPDDEFGEQVKAYCELKPNHDASEAELSDFAAEHLASYKRPRSYEIVAELPRNTMGKILKRDLRDPYWQNKERQV